MTGNVDEEKCSRKLLISVLRTPNDWLWPVFTEDEKTSEFIQPTHFKHKFHYITTLITKQHPTLCLTTGQ